MGAETDRAPPLPADGDRPVRVHGAAEARAALEAAVGLGVPVTLVSAPAAGAHGGAAWFLALVEAARAGLPAVGVTAVLDCADRAGDAQAAVAAGVRHLLFTGPAPVAERLAAIAAARGAVVLTALPPVLELRGRRDAAAACREWLAAK